MKEYSSTSNPQKISLIVSSLLSLFIAILYLSSTFIFSEIAFHWIAFIVFEISIFLFTFFVFSYVLKNFIFDKIRLIYKTIRKQKVDKKDIQEIRINQDLIREVREEVEEWSKEHQHEISLLKAQENFRREYIGNISHELKNPIFNIQGYILSLLDGGLEDKKITKKYLKRTSRNIDRIITILEDLDTISELEIENISPNFTSFDILKLTKEVVELFVDKAGEKNISIFYREKYSSEIRVFGDEKRIKQVLINLIDNAIKYSPDNKKIKISFFDMDKNYLIEITDEGIGISEADLPRVFERFFRTDKARSPETGGTGLGLAIVKHIIEAHKQTINARSKIGVGTTFAFTLKKG